MKYKLQTRRAAEPWKPSNKTQDFQLQEFRKTPDVRTLGANEAFRETELCQRPNGGDEDGLREDVETAVRKIMNRLDSGGDGVLKPLNYQEITRLSRSPVLVPISPNCRNISDLKRFSFPFFTPPPRGVRSFHLTPLELIITSVPPGAS